MTNYCRSLVEDFEELAKDIQPTGGFIKAVKRAAHEVFQILKEKSRQYDIRIDRTRICGSIGKGTGIRYEDEEGYSVDPDVDCVIYVNDQSPPFEVILQIWKEILETNYLILNVRVTKHSVKFNYSDEFETVTFDLLPAKNYIQNYKYQNKTVGEVQAQLAMNDLSRQQQNYIRNGQKINMDLNKLYSSCFSEKTVEFIQDYVEENFILTAVRLAKYWCANLEFNGYVPAKSCTIELIAINAQQKKRCGRICIISGFRRFLEDMSNFRCLRVCFNKRNKLPYNFWSNIHSGDITEGADYLLTSGSFSPAPIIIDPTNHYNNFVYGIKEETVEFLEDQARKTLDVLDGLKRSEDYENVENAIDEIFCHKQ